MSELARLMLDQIPQILLLVEPHTLQIVLANTPASKTLGYTTQQLENMLITEVECALPDVFFWEDARSGQVIDLPGQQSEYRRANGDLLSVNKTVSVIKHGDASLLMVQASSATHERKAEDALAHTLSQLRATLESTGNGILVLNWQGRIDSMNRLFGKMWPLSDELLETHDDARILEFVASRVLESDLLRARLDAILDSGETLDLLHHQDGQVFEASSRPQYIGEQIVGRVFGFQDITLHTRAEAALRESRDSLESRVLARTADLNAANATLQVEKAQQAVLIKRLEEAHNQLLQSERMASIGQLAAGVAHEINNPVGFVNSNLGSLQIYVRDLLRLLAAYEKSEAVLASDAVAPIQKIKEEIDLNFLREDLASLLAESQDGLQRVKRIVQDLKDFSHVDESERQWADIEAGLESTLRVVNNEVKYKADVVKQFCGLPQIECFPFQLNQVFMNLLVNASHAIEGRGTITLRTGQDERELWVEVQDSGKGIQPENLQRIFDPFFTTKPVGQGTGLGLSLSYGIVHKHGGRIEVKSEVGTGTVFRVVLPKPLPVTVDLPP